MSVFTPLLLYIIMLHFSDIPCNVSTVYIRSSRFVCWWHELQHALWW